MRIGSAWTKTKQDSGKTYISVSFDEAFLELCPQFKNCNCVLSYIDPKDRKSEKSPGWTLYLMRKEEQKATQTTAASTTDEAPVNEEDIPF